MTGAYDILEEDTLISASAVHEKSQKDPDDSGISALGITLIKESTQDGTLVDDGGRYVQLDVQFVGSSARPVTIWGKEVLDEAYSGPVRFNEREKLRLGLGIEEQWTWEPDLHELHVSFLPESAPLSVGGENA